MSQAIIMFKWAKRDFYPVKHTIAAYKIPAIAQLCCSESSSLGTSINCLRLSLDPQPKMKLQLILKMCNPECCKLQWR